MERQTGPNPAVQEDDLFNQEMEVILGPGESRIVYCPTCPGHSEVGALTDNDVDQIGSFLKPRKVGFKCPHCEKPMEGFVRRQEFEIQLDHSNCSLFPWTTSFLFKVSVDRNGVLTKERIPLSTGVALDDASEEEPEENPPRRGLAFHDEESCSNEVHLRETGEDGEFIVAKASPFPEKRRQEKTHHRLFCKGCEKDATLILEDFFSAEEEAPLIASATLPNPRLITFTHLKCKTSTRYELRSRPGLKGLQEYIPPIQRRPTAPIAQTAQWVREQADPTRPRVSTPPLPAASLHTTPATVMPAAQAGLPPADRTPLVHGEMPSPQPPPLQLVSPLSVEKQPIRGRRGYTQRLALGIIAGVGLLVAVNHMRSSSDGAQQDRRPSPVATEPNVPPLPPEPQPVSPATPPSPLPPEPTPPCPEHAYCFFEGGTEGNPLRLKGCISGKSPTLEIRKKQGKELAKVLYSEGCETEEIPLDKIREGKLRLQPRR